VIIGDEARRLLAVSAAYAALTFVMAYPLSASPHSTVVVDAPDTHVYIWTLAWDTYAFLHQPLRIFEANIYHPFPHTLAFSENLIGSAFFAAPFIWLTGNLVLGMNMAALITCVLCGVGGYVLARALHLRPSTAFLCGLVYAFAPPRFFRLGQLHMTAVQWIPFTLAFLHLYLDRGTRKYLLSAVACFTLQVLSSGHGAAFTAVASHSPSCSGCATSAPPARSCWRRRLSCCCRIDSSASKAACGTATVSTPFPIFRVFWRLRHACIPTCSASGSAPGRSTSAPTRFCFPAFCSSLRPQWRSPDGGRSRASTGARRPPASTRFSASFRR
jgi:hypothetical protein